MTHKQLHILLIEPDEVDSEFIRRCLKQHTSHHVITATVGSEAFHRLRGSEGYERLPRPYLILLNVELEGRGLAWLDELRQDAVLKGSVVFAMGNSERVEDKQAAFDRSVAGYFVKHRLKQQVARFIQLLDCYSQVIEFPPDVERWDTAPS